MPFLSSVQPLIAGPEQWMKHLAATDGRHAANDGTARTYLRFLMSMLSGLVLSCDMSAPLNSLSYCMEPFRDGGNGVRSDKLNHGITMAGHARMESIVAMIKDVVDHGPKGSYLEAGVWRGGMSIMATAALHVYGASSRPVYICDSYEGLPLPRDNSARRDESFYHNVPVYKQVLSVGEQQVLRNFDLFGIPRDNVVPIKGYFVNSLPPLRQELVGRGEKLAILRMDGDMYDSTVDILYNLYDLVQLGGYIVIDDYGWGWGADSKNQERPSKSLFGAKDALLDFRLIHGIEDDAHMIHDIDGGGAWFRKAREVSLLRDRYLSVLANHSTMQDQLMPQPARTHGDVRRLQARWHELEEKQSSPRLPSWQRGLKIYQDVKSRCSFNKTNWREVIAESASHIAWHL